MMTMNHVSAAMLAAAFQRAITGPDESLENLDYKAMKLRQVRTDISGEIKRLEQEAKRRENAPQLPLKG